MSAKIGTGISVGMAGLLQNPTPEKEIVNRTWHVAWCNDALSRDNPMTSTRAPPHPIPAAALDGHLAVLGTSGYGKSNAVKGAVEGLLERGERVVIVDPTGVWWGLRLLQDGKRPSSYPLVIFGGRHGDLPLDAGSGARVAHVLGAATTPAILDTQMMSVAARTRFFTDFAETIIRENRGPLHLVIDEAHLFAPQSGGTGLVPALLHATNNLVSLGRSAGLSIVLITQRAAKLHKDALSQATALVVMGLVDPRDQKAAKGWLDGAPDQSRAREIMASLAGLPVGTGWIYAPRLGVLEQANFPLVATYDSGRPEANADAPALKPLDVAALREAMLIFSTAKEDVKINMASRSAGGSASANEMATAERRGYERGLRAAADHIGDFSLEWRVGAQESTKFETMNRHPVGRVFAEAILDLIKTAGALNDAKRLPKSLSRPASDDVKAARAPRPRPRTQTVANGVLHGSSLTGPQRQLLKSLAWWKCIGHSAPTRAQVAAIAGWRVTSGHLKNVAGSLSSAKMIHYPAPGTFAFTPKGEAAAPMPDMGVTLTESLSAMLTGPQRAVFDVLLRESALSREDLARECGWEPSSGHVKNVLGSLRTLEIVHYPNPGFVALQGWLTGERL